MSEQIDQQRKAELLSKKVEHIDIKSFDARPIIDSMRKMSFSSRDTARAADIFNMALEDKDCSPWLILAGSTSAGAVNKEAPASAAASPVAAPAPVPVSVPAAAPPPADEAAAMLALVRRISELEAENAALRRLLASPPVSGTA